MARTRANDFHAKKHDLLRAAAAVIADQGIDKASMAQIAARSGVSKALLYHYYPAKDALICEIIRDHLEALDAAMAAADDPALDPGARLRRLIGATLENYRGADNEHKVQINAVGALTDAQRGEITAIERRIVRRVAAVLAEVNPGLASPDRPLLMPATMSVFGMLNWVYMWFRDGGAITREDYADLATTLVLDGVRQVR